MIDELDEIFKRISNNLKLNNSDNIPSREFMLEVFKPNSKIGIYLFSLYTLVISEDKIVLEGDMLLNFTNAIRDKISNPIVLLTNCFLMLNIIKEVEHNENKIVFEFLNNDIKQMFKQLEQVQFKELENKYIKMYNNGCSKEEVLYKILKDFEYEANKINSNE